MFRIFYEGRDYDVCPALVAKLFRNQMLTDLKCHPEKRLMLSRVDRVEPVRGTLHNRCEEHGTYCPDEV